MFITAPAGLTITTIKITGTGSQTSNWGLNLVEGGGTFEIVDNAHLWTAPETGNVNSVTFEMPSTVSGRTDIDKIEVEAKKIETGIANVSVEDENAPVEYYNLQGIRVANPENGLYIRRQGNTATKVLIK